MLDIARATAKKQELMVKTLGAFSASINLRK